MKSCDRADEGLSHRLRGPRRGFSASPQVVTASKGAARTHLYVSGVETAAVEEVVGAGAFQAVALVDQVLLPLVRAVEFLAHRLELDVEFEVRAHEREPLYAHERDLALQVGLLPAARPTVPGVSVSACAHRRVAPRRGRERRAC